MEESESKKTVTLVSKKYNKKEYAKQGIVLPVVGQVTFNDDGTVTVPEDQAEELIAYTESSFNFVIKGDEKGEKELQDLKAAEEEDEEMKAQLAGMELKELLELVKETDIPLDRAAGYTDAKLRAELLKRLSKK